MRYGNPSIAAGARPAARGGLRPHPRLPLYPQYAASTTASAFDAVTPHRAARCGACPALRVVDASTTIPATSRRSRSNVNDYWVKHGRPDRLVLSFHGLPRRTLDRGDPYHCQCQVTARLLARELGLEAEQWTLTFQSRFGARRVAQALHGGQCCARSAQRRRRARRRGLPGLRRRLPRDARGNRHRGASRRSSTPAARNSTPFPASTSIRCGSPRWPTSCSRTSQGWLAPPPDAAAREATALRAKALGAQP